LNTARRGVAAHIRGEDVTDVDHLHEVTEASSCRYAYSFCLHGDCSTGSRPRAGEYLRMVQSGSSFRYWPMMIDLLDDPYSSVVLYKM
jgi:hypothetical protein